MSNFAKYWSSAACSNLADGVYLVALPLLALQVTDSPAMVAGVTVAVRLPWLLFSLMAGVAADRWNRKRLLQSSATLRALALAVLTYAVAADAATIWLVYAVAFVLGSAETVGDTTAHTALPALVPASYLDRANGLLQTAQLAGAQFVAPAVTGMLAAVAIALATGTGAVLYAAAAIAVSTVATPMGPGPRQEHEARSVVRDIQEGLGYLWGHGYLRPMAATLSSINLALGAFFAILPVHAVAPGPMGLDERGYGLLLGAMGAGALVALAVVFRLPGDRLTGGVMVLCVAVLAAATLVPFVVSAAAVVAAALAAFGAALLLFNVRTLSIRQRLVPDAILGRVNASYRLCAYGALPIGGALGGAVGETVGVVWVFPLCTAVIAVTMPMVRRAFRAVPVA